MSEQLSASNPTLPENSAAQANESLRQSGVDIESLRLSTDERQARRQVRAEVIAAMNQLDPQVTFTATEEDYTQYLHLDSTVFHTEAVGSAAIQDSVKYILQSIVRYLDLPIINDNIDELPEAEVDRLRALIATTTGADLSTPTYDSPHGLRRSFRKLYKLTPAGEGNETPQPASFQEAYQNKMRINQVGFVSMIGFLPTLLEPQVNQLPPEIRVPVAEKVAELRAAVKAFPTPATIQEYNEGTVDKKEFITNVCASFAQCARVIQELLYALADAKKRSGAMDSTT